MAFLGTPEPAARVLHALAAAGHEVALVVTRADKRRGRAQAPGPSPVKSAALELGIEVTDRVDDLPCAGAEIGVVVAFGRIVPKRVLDVLAMVNLHFSLLPRWRGAAPVERAILAGDRTTGICLMAVDEGLDTGPVYCSRELPIGADETAAALRSRLTEAGTALLLESLASGLGTPLPQEGVPTYAERIATSDLRLDWSRPSDELYRVVRLGRAWTTWRGRRLLVLEARPVGGPAPAGEGPPGSVRGDLVLTGDGALRLSTVQAEGRRPVPAGEWTRGARPAPGEVLGG